MGLCGEELEVNTGAFTGHELRCALRKFSKGKSPGSDGVPMEVWQALVRSPDSMQKLLDLCNECWDARSIPTSWAHASVVTIFKKGDTSLPSNYRPISLLNVGYKVLASMLLARLQQGGAEQRIQSAQYGFRKGRGTTDALFITRRIMDAALDDKEGPLYVILLDWSKAFDRISSRALVVALSKFGVPRSMVAMIKGIYAARTFSVRDTGVESAVHRQNAGIAQGCPLSPYLFVIVMTVLLKEALVARGPADEKPYVVTPELV